MPISASSTFHLPFASDAPIVLTQGIGGGFSHTGRLFHALDFALPNGSPVYGIGDGVVVSLHNGAADFVPPAGSNGSTVDASLNPLPGAAASMGPGLLGNYVTVRHLLAVEGGTRDIYVTYAHLAQDSMGALQVGSIIRADQPLGQTGLTGAMYSSKLAGSAAHLHIQFGTTLRALGEGLIASAVDSEANHAYSYFRAAPTGIGPIQPIDISAPGFFSNAEMAQALQIEAARDGQPSTPITLAGFAHSGAQSARFAASPLEDRAREEGPFVPPVAGSIERVSVASDGTEGNGWSESPSISADGRFVVFRSWASSFVPGDTNGHSDIFVHDRLTGQTDRVSVASDGTEGNDWSEPPSISADGRFVAFWSEASNLVPGDTNGTWDIFVATNPLFDGLPDTGIDIIPWGMETTFVLPVGGSVQGRID